MLQFKSQNQISLKKTSYKTPKISTPIIIFSFLFIMGLVIIPSNTLKLLLVALFPFEYFIVFTYANKLALKLLSFDSDLETGKSICSSDLIAIDLDQYIDASKSIITHLETLDQVIPIDDPASGPLLKRKSMTKLLQTALLCEHDDSRLVPNFEQLKALIPFDDETLEVQWPKLRSWENEGIWFTQHQENKTHMTQLMCMGDIDRLLERCTHVLTQNGIDILKKEHVAKIIASEHKHGQSLERMWGYAFKIDSKDNQSFAIPSDLIYIGAISVFAPLITNVADAQFKSSENMFKVISFSEESPVYVNSIAKKLNLIDEDHRILDQTKLMTYSNKTLEPVLDRYAFFTRFEDDQKHRILSLYLKKNRVIMRATKVHSPLNKIDESIFGFLANKGYSENAFTQAFIESQNLERRYAKLFSFVLTIHLIELITLNFMYESSPYFIVIMNLIVTLILGTALFVEAVEIKYAHEGTLKTIFLNGIFIGLFCLININQFSTIPFLGLNLVGMAFMLQNHSSISLRQIALKKTPLNAAAGFLIICLLGVATFEMRNAFDVNLLMKLVAYSFTPMILHDLLKLSKMYIHKFSAIFKS